jgi:hypothetical protein
MRVKLISSPGDSQCIGWNQHARHAPGNEATPDKGSNACIAVLAVIAL